MFSFVYSPNTVIAAVGVSFLIIIWKKIIKSGPVYEGTKQLDGKTVVVTGANVGIGKETAVCLAKRKARVIIACRNESKALKALQDIKEASGNEDVHFMRLDLSDFYSVRKFVEEFEKNQSRLDILVNNAAASGPGHTKDGYDLMLVTNQMGPFLLTNLLLPMMKKTSSSSPVRIVNVSADAYKVGKIDFDTFKPTPDKHLSPVQSVAQYANTKLMNIYFTSELNKRLRVDDPECNITTYSLHPGVIDSRLGDDYAESFGVFFGLFIKVFKFLFMCSTFHGCQTTLHCCLEDGLESKSGKYFRGMKEQKLLPKACDQEIGRKLWGKCEGITGLVQ